jgi:hypothetical protein
VALDLFTQGVLIGSVVRGLRGCYAYTPSGAPLGEYADLDAAAAALAARVSAGPIAA